jgi:hypothetical protein
MNVLRWKGRCWVFAVSLSAETEEIKQELEARAIQKSSSE